MDYSGSYLCRIFLKFFFLFLALDYLYTKTTFAESALSEFTEKQDLELIKQRSEAINISLTKEPFVLNQLKLSREEYKALALALNSADFLRDIRGKNNQALLSEIFTVRPALPSDLLPSELQTNSLSAISKADKTASQVKSLAKRFLIERYNYALNETIVAIVGENRVMRVDVLKGLQADIPNHLANLAIAIARTSNLVKQALNDNQHKIYPVMAETKTALNSSRCERSQKLCVAPTFVYGDKALWAIINLTDLTVAGIRWTNVGKSTAQPISERAVQDDYISSEYCEKSHHFASKPWQISYHLTASDGLELFDIKYDQRKILESIKLVDWHVSYSRVDGFGYSDAIGCPIFSESAVIATTPPKIINNTSGDITITQDYFSQGWPQPCSYNYAQTAEFNHDGSFRYKAANLGRGCGNDATYRPVFRYSFPQGVKIEEWTNNSWKLWEKEGWTKQSETVRYYQNKYQWRVTYPDNYMLLIEPANGQFTDSSRQDNAYIFLTKHKASEGDNNLITIGPCCNNDHRQGPERFIEERPETLGERITFWYVPTIRNDDRVGHEYCWAKSNIQNGIYAVETFPCYSGPRFVPYSLNKL